MLLSLDPDRMAQLGLTVSDVAAAVQEQNATNPAGRIGREPSPPGTQLTIPVVTAGPRPRPAGLRGSVVAGRTDGRLGRAYDPGRSQVGVPDDHLGGPPRGKPTAPF